MVHMYFWTRTLTVVRKYMQKCFYNDILNNSTSIEDTMIQCYHVECV